ncbi:hypothetical protein ACFWIA_03625 [Streptomyces sp. NPDC127068]|uniref:hypothetical protein n=1 Tax=Streptomyces sp. NPDC127068 TaxID=3347127 RepID=UPI00364DB832
MSATERVEPPSAAVPMDVLLAACAAARAVSTPPTAATDTETGTVSRPGPVHERHEGPRAA